MAGVMFCVICAVILLQVTVARINLSPTRLTIMDSRALQRRVATLENKVEDVEAANGYGKVFAMHLQSDVPPPCPWGTWALWEGYSLVKFFDGSGYIDLADPGSCMRTFDPVPHVLCRGRKCKLTGENWKTTWLWNRNKNREGIMASRCSVCESAKSLLVVHSQNSTKPNCPTGFTSDNFWSGYSFISAGQSGKISMSSIGSCLPYFESSPFIECDSKSCKVVQASNVWLRATPKKRFTPNGDFERETIKSRDAMTRISRCRVCALYTPMDFPRDRRVIEHDSAGIGYR